MVNTICNKSVKDLVNRVCAETGLSRKKAQEAVAAVFAEISDTLEENGAVNVLKWPRCQGQFSDSSGF